MRVHGNLADWRWERSGPQYRSCSIGFVPTMGALHEGHRLLLERARAENDCVVLSLFVNPTQFNDPRDLEKYPRTLEADLALARGLVDDVIVPTREELYPDGYQYRVTENQLSRELEGAHRPGHFDGVLTVVLKLLNLVQPRRAYFGEKDWQQLQLVRGMANALFLPCEIIPCATVRDADGLALSSRNARLSASARAQAAEFPKILGGTIGSGDAAAALEDAGFEVDYVEDRDGVRLGAVRLEGVRLIDNVRI
ncbi:MAG TPA: pantoate--beta-alanine ligase [Candidatus Didemnitutus sp.]|nr:pantoate--beta-alanine ligase [Candidatus Didemnitutus sp.]